MKTDFLQRKHLKALEKRVKSSAPNKERLAAVAKGEGRKFGYLVVHIHKLLCGAEIVSENGWLIAEFSNHLDARRFMELLPRAHGK